MSFSIFAQAATQDQFWTYLTDALDKTPIAVVTLLWVMDRIGNNSERNYLRAKDQQREDTMVRANEAMAHALEIVTQYSKTQPK